jgi:Adenylate and Guanylate cyclase catalytic domain
VLKIINTSKAIIGGFLRSEAGGLDSPDPISSYYAGFLSYQNQQETSYEGDVMSTLGIPVYGSYDRNDTEVVAIMYSIIQLGSYFKEVLPHEAHGIFLVFSNPCQEPQTYLVEGATVKYLGIGDQHDTTFDRYKVSASFKEFDLIEDGTEYGIDLDNTSCPISIAVYPSKYYYDEYNTSLPITMTATVMLVFLFTVVMFLIYDRLVENRQRLILQKELQSRSIVTSLFPKNVADRLLQNDHENDHSRMSNKNKLKTFLNPGDEDNNGYRAQEPIADLFPNTTVLFADIAGFTAWSSSREPSQVFLLLQGVYQAFDHIAKRRKVFKVETIGDSYVAVTGLPDPQANHAIIMARFATECIHKMVQVATELDSRLGPGTSGTFFFFFFGRFLISICS